MSKFQKIEEAVKPLNNDYVKIFILFSISYLFYTSIAGLSWYGFAPIAQIVSLDASDSAPMRDILAGNRFEAQKQGVIAVISSVAGDRGRQSNYVYGAAKGAVSIFLQGLRNRLHKSGIQVLTIKPGFVDTPMTASFKKGPLWSSRRGGCLQHQLSMAGLCMPRI